MSSRKRLFEEKEEEIERLARVLRGGRKKTPAAAAAPKKEVNENEEEEVPTPKRIKVWKKSTELTDEFLVKEIGILSLAEVTLQQLNSSKVKELNLLAHYSDVRGNNWKGLLNSQWAQ